MGDYNGRNVVVTGGTGALGIADEAAVARYYAGTGDLWASIHLAGGFAMKPAAETGKADLAAMLTINLVTCQLCSAAALKAMRRGGQGGRIVNVAALTQAMAE